MDADHNIADQSSPNPPVAPLETAETVANAALHTDGVTIEEEIHEEEKVIEAEPKTEEEQSDEQDSDDDSNYTVADETEEEESSDDDEDDDEISEVDSEHTAPAVRGEQQTSDVDVDSDRTIPAVREDDYSSDEEDYDENSDYSDRYSESRYPFQRFYSCGPITGNSREHLEQGNLIVMPESALGELYRARPEFPMLFEIRNHATERVSHCGVAEFTAEEGTVMVPGWMMENLKAEAGDTLYLKNVTLEKGTFAKIQPHSVAFWAIRDMKTTLEQTLSAKFLCLTTGDTIAIDVGSKTYYIDIVETKPADAVCIVDTDCAVDFALPLDYKDPAPVPAPPQDVGGRRGFVPFSGVARRLNGKAAAAGAEGETQSARAESSGKMEAKPVVTAAETPKQSELKKPFQPFTGKKYTLAD